MKEIKFRAWTDQGTQGTFRMENDIGILPSKHSEHWLENGLGLFLQTGSSHKLMQYTGLKDKNGKEIYEGDIVEIYDDKYKIVYSAPTFREVGIGNSRNRVMTGSFVGDIIYHLKIIGNIYENPELLK